MRVTACLHFGRNIGLFYRNKDVINFTLYSCKARNPLIDTKRVVPFSVASRKLSTEDLNTTSNVTQELSSVSDNVAQVTEIAQHSLSIWPSDILRDILMYMHDGIGFEWCPAIMIGTAMLRLLTIPPFAMSRAFSVRTMNNAPENAKLMAKLNAAGNKFQFGKAQMELIDFHKRTNTNPIKAMLYVLPSAGLFCSFFLGIKKMTSLPVESLTTGGYLWFKNLAVVDPYFIIPVLCCSSMWLAIRFGGAEADMGPLANNVTMMKIIPFIPLISLPFICYQPAAMGIYWLTNNCITFCLMMIFKIQPVRKAFGIPAMTEHSAEDVEFMNKQQSELMNFWKKTNNNSRTYQQRIEQHKRMIQKSEPRNKPNNKM